jgi:hypothetical protein
MRQADRDEIRAASGRSPGAALAFSLRKSSLAYTALINGRPEVMFGVGDINVLARVGAPWLLGTEAVRTHYVAFLRASLEWREQLLGRYRVLMNAVDDRNGVSKRWLTWLGFTLGPPVALGVEQRLFRVFRMEAPDV